jgi:hypothetical protein
MKRVGWILLGGLFLAQPGQALKDTPASPEPDARREEFSNELGAFVRQAVKEGLLEAPGSAKPAEGPKRIVPEVEMTPVQAEPVAPAAAGPIDCSAPYPLDFSGFGELKTYRDIYAYREDTVPEGQAQEAHAGATLAKAYIALDLASEAAMTVKTGRDQQAVALQNLAMLLERQAPVPAAYFSELATCYPQADIWRAISLITKQDEAGAQLIETQMEAFGELPLQLRDRAAMITVPALDAMGQREIAQALLASFSEEEIANSSQLQFSKAVVELGAGSSDAEHRIEAFLIQSRFQEDALASLVRHKRPVNSNVREILVDDLVTKIELAQKDADVRADLRFVLDELSRSSMYLPMMRLAELPSMQSDAARQELTQHLLASLKRDLASDESLRNLAAIEALIKDPGLLDAVPDRAALYESATVLAVRLGFGSLGDALAEKAKGGEGIAEQRAVLAYRQKSVEEVYDLAAHYPANEKINRLAALVAIERGDRARLSAFESRLHLEPETILALIEQDATTGRWIVPDRVYQAALKLEADDQRWRVDRVMRLKHLPAQPVPGMRLAMSTIPDKLDRSRASLAQLSAEAP